VFTRQILPQISIRCSVTWKCHSLPAQKISEKSGPLRAASKEARKEGVSSGKAMQGVAVQAHARTLVLGKSKKLEEG